MGDVAGQYKGATSREREVQVHAGQLEGAMGVGQKCDRKVGGSRGQRRCSRLVVTSWREHELVGAMAGQ